MSHIFRILEKDEIFFELCKIKGGHYSHRNIHYDFCIVGQERVKCFRYYYCSIFNKPFVQNANFGSCSDPTSHMYAFVCISVDPPTPLGAYVINGRPLEEPQEITVND